MSRKCAATSVLQFNLETNPELRARQTDIRAQLESTIALEAAPIKRDIPVVVHILDQNDPNIITDAQVHSQIDVLNEDFNADNADLNTVPNAFKSHIGEAGIKFHLAKDGITRTKVNVAAFPTDDSMKRAATGGVDAWDTRKYLNIWVCQMTGGILGYAQFPDGGEPETDGVVVLTTAFGRGGVANSPFDLGRTATHEVGHFLGLFHIWGNSLFPSCSDDDEVADTPVQLQANTDKPTFPSVSCSNGPDGDMFMNYMDYVDDDTMVMFSAGQVERMHAALAVSRPDLGV